MLGDAGARSWPRAAAKSGEPPSEKERRAAAGKRQKAVKEDESVRNGTNWGESGDSVTYRLGCERFSFWNAYNEAPI